MFLRVVCRYRNARHNFFHEIRVKLPCFSLLAANVVPARCVIEILGDGKYWNHSATPNTGAPPDAIHTWALRDIKKGEQLLDDYGVYDNPPFFQRLCKQFGVVYHDPTWE